MKQKQITLILFIILTFLITGCYNQDNLKFEFSDCKYVEDLQDEMIQYIQELANTTNLTGSEIKQKISSSDKYSIFDTNTNPKYGVVSTEWIDNNTIFIKAMTNENCGTSDFKGSYSIGGDKIGLRYKPTLKKWQMTNCFCSFQLEYTIYNLNKIDYLITLE